MRYEIIDGVLQAELGRANSTAKLNKQTNDQAGLLAEKTCEVAVTGHRDKIEINK